MRPILDAAASILGNDQVPLAEGYATFRVSNAVTPTPAAVYADAALSISRGSQVSMDGAGRLPVCFLDPAIDYAVDIYDSDSNYVFTVETLQSATATASTPSLSVVESIVALRATTWGGDTPDAVYILSRATAGDGGGFFRRDGNVTTYPDDGVLVIGDDDSNAWHYQTTQALYDADVPNGLSDDGPNTPVMFADNTKVQRWHTDYIEPLVPTNDTTATASIAAASTLPLHDTDGDFVTCTGNTGIAATDLAENEIRTVVFSGTPTITAGANMLTPGGDDITAYANLVLVMRGEGSGVTRIIGGAQPKATKAQVQAFTVDGLMLTPENAKYLPMIPVAWVNFNGQGAVAIRGSHNVTSITDNGTGDYTINFTNALESVNYVVVATASGAGSATPLENVGVCVEHVTSGALTDKTVNHVRVLCSNKFDGPAGAGDQAFDPLTVNIIIMGALA